MVGQRLARAEHRQQTHRAALVVGELGDQSRLGAFGQADQTRQGLVRVGGAGQQRHQRIGRFPEPGELVGGAAESPNPSRSSRVRAESLRGLTASIYGRGACAASSIWCRLLGNFPVQLVT
jgi:hypothetical protein